MHLEDKIKITSDQIVIKKNRSKSLPKEGTFKLILQVIFQKISKHTAQMLREIIMPKCHLRVII